MIRSTPYLSCPVPPDAEVNGNIDLALEWLRKKGMAIMSKKSGRAASEGLVAVATAGDGKSAAVVEVNSETDFVARNEWMQRLASGIAEVAVNIPRGDDMAAVSSAPIKPLGPDFRAPNVSEAVAEVVSKVRENVVFRRVQKLSVKSDGFVSVYVHNKTAENENLGQIVTLLAVETPATGDALEQVKEVSRKVAMHVAAAKPLYLTRSQVPVEDIEKEKNILKTQALASGKEEKFIEKMIMGRMNKFFQETTLLDQGHMLEEGNPAISKVQSLLLLLCHYLTH
jgi:elongation factor Ts